MGKREEIARLEERLRRLKASKHPSKPMGRHGRKRINPDELERKVKKGKSTLRKKYPGFTGAMDNLARNMWG